MTDGKFKKPQFIQSEKGMSINLISAADGIIIKLNKIVLNASAEYLSKPFKVNIKCKIEKQII